MVASKYSTATLTTVLVVVVVACYINSLFCDFVFDDVMAIRDNQDLKPSTPISNLFYNDFWGTPMNKEQSHKSYRPLTVLTFRLNYMVGQLEPYGYHLVNIGLHAIVSVLFMHTCRLFFSHVSSFFAALLFAVHPIHTEAVTGVVGRAELLSALASLGAFLIYTKTSHRHKPTAWWYILATFVLTVAATLCKEQGITILGVCCVYELFVIQELNIYKLLSLAKNLVLLRWKLVPAHISAALPRLLVLVFSAVAMLGARLYIMQAQIPVFTRHDNPASAASTPARQLTYAYLLPINFWLLLCPSWLCCDWTMGTIPLVQTITDLRNLCTLAFALGFGAITCKAIAGNSWRSKQLVMCLAFMVLPFLPASNLFFPVGFVVAERILYLPSCGFCMIVILGLNTLHQLSHHWKNMLYAIYFYLIITHSVKTITRNMDWESEYRLFSSAVKINKNNAKVWNNVGHALENMKEWEFALQYFLTASKVQPDDVGAWLNLGRTYKQLERRQQAEGAYRVAMDLMPPVIPGRRYTARVAPNHLNVYLNLANLVKEDPSRLKEADQLYRTVIEMRPDFVQAYINRGDVLVRLGRSQEAEQSYLTALNYGEENADIYYNLGVVCANGNRFTEAVQYFDKAAQVNPSHKQALFNAAVAMQESGKPELRPEAVKRLLNLMQSDADNEMIYFNLGLLAMDDDNQLDGEKWFKKVIELKPDFRGALFNLALLYSEMEEELKAVPYLLQLLKYYPDHVKGLLLLGDIYLNKLKVTNDARKCFERILQAEPNNVQARHNLCVVHVEEGDLGAAEKCLLQTLKLAPNEQYIRNHLGVVQGKLRGHRLPPPQSSQSRGGTHNPNSNSAKKVRQTTEIKEKKKKPKTTKMGSYKGNS